MGTTPPIHWHTPSVERGSCYDTSCYRRLLKVLGMKELRRGETPLETLRPALPPSSQLGSWVGVNAGTAALAPSWLHKGPGIL